MNKSVLNCLSLFLLSVTGFAQEIIEQTKDSVQTLNEVIIENKYKYRREKSSTVAKLPLNNIENPQVYNTVTSELLKEQVVTNFNDALKNATGVSRLWESTGRGGDGAEFFTMRGFSVQPTMINGLPGINNGSIDPINVDNIEVIKGPSGTLFGSSLISYGGLINIVTKKPHQTLGGEIGYIAGNYGLDRITADVNIPLNSDVSIRVNAARQKENSFQDAGFGKSFFIAPSLSYKVNDKLSFVINTEFTERTSANAPMIFLSRFSPLTFNSIEVFEQNYKKSYTSNELTLSNPTFNMQAQMLYKLSNSWTSQTVLSRSSSKTDGYYSYLFDDSNGDTFTRYISKRNGETLATDIQQNFIGDFKIGTMRNRMVIGIDYYGSNILNGSTGWVGAGTVSLLNQTDTYTYPNSTPQPTNLTQAGMNELLARSTEPNADAESQVVSAYVSNVINFTDKLSVMASLRVDEFRGKTSYFSSEKIDSQIAFSPKFGAVYQLLENKVSVFGNYMNGFQNVEPANVLTPGASTSSLIAYTPERADQFEFGFKTNLYKDIISATASYYGIAVENRVMSNGEQSGKVESKGVEVSLTVNPVKGLNIIAGYSNNKSEVTEDVSTDGYLGLRPEEAGPETLINFWANYTFHTGKLKGFGLGLGGNYASEHKTLNRSNIGTFELPEYTVLNSAASYNSDKFNITLKLNNVLNEKYYTGWSTVTPQRLRSLSVGLAYKF